MVDISAPSFIPAPTIEQRNWIINHGMKELGFELKNAHLRAPEMNTGGGPIRFEDRKAAQLNAQEIMEDWQMPVMQAMAGAVSISGGDVPEVGFGRGVSATMIQAHGVASHTIIDCNHNIIMDAKSWKKAT